ncbi:MAG TPA: protein phosphatase CheZ [Methylovirgula sp.]|nr:protein phosphatase CheZ [Xanthobacteraceae bacterium]HKH80548.1 protein phosphatase CheZ [Methylovirgula sp.]
MAAPRKIFRIEETAALSVQSPIDGSPTPQLADIMQELSALRALFAQSPIDSGASQHDEIQRLTSELRRVHSAISGTEPEPAGGNGPRAPAAAPTRIADELEAVMAGGEQATQRILAAAEDIDQAANTLSAALKSDLEQGLAQDIRDRVIQIFEACNYQDLTGQRVAKVMAMLARIERQIARALNERSRAAPSAHGPRLPNDRGHVSQSDVDTMFEGEAKSKAKSA